MGVIFFIKNNKRGGILNYLFHYLSALNILDAVLTFFGLEYSIIGEMNPIMEKLYNIHPLIFLFSKFILSFCLYLFIIFKRVPKSKSSKVITYVATGLYTFIFVLHSVWLIEYVSLYT
ncbi:DUF5658 family protein [Bacillus sp. T3]|uniref:DUF5658 family protein n=1 Tax=Bacillus sp. T3 TaxID=467262 RepID=UPI003994DC72